MSGLLDQLSNIFEERAENLSRDELFSWSADMPNDKEILRKIKGPGAKLLTGPRGSGKSTILRRAYFDLLENGNTLPVYVNYARSLALEPFFHKKANALQIFQQWLIAKIIAETFKAIEALGESPPLSLTSKCKNSKTLIHSLETGSNNPRLVELISPTEIVVLLEDWCKYVGKSRCVLLMDDAAHAFSSEQQREFFEVFRSLKSRVVSAKAAVYPGVTSYSSNFHVGHEAELIEAWCNPHAQDYKQLMRGIIRRRLPSELEQKLSGKEELIDYLALASFGIPRAFLNMIAQLVGVDEDSPSRPTKILADAAISSHAHNVKSVFRSLSQKLPRFKNFISVGDALQAAITNNIRNYNTINSERSKAVSLAIADPIATEVGRILSFMEYAGMVRKLEPVSKSRVLYQRFVIHYAVLLDERALALGKSPSTQSVVDALSARNVHAIPYCKQSVLISDDQLKMCVLDLGPCTQCGAARASSEAKFCISCGNELRASSIYEDLMCTPVEALALTHRKITGMKAESNIRTVKDILMDDESRELRKVAGIGPVWARRIHTAAEEYISI